MATSTERTQRWRDRHPEEPRAYARAYQAKVKAADPVAYRARKRTESRARKGFVLTHEEELAIYEDSDGLCAICYEVPATAIDHDHETGEPRGAVCRAHNQALGAFGDDRAGVERVLAYLDTPLLLGAGV